MNIRNCFSEVALSSKLKCCRSTKGWWLQWGVGSFCPLKISNGGWYSHVAHLNTAANWDFSDLPNPTISRWWSRLQATTEEGVSGNVVPFCWIYKQNVTQTLTTTRKYFAWYLDSLYSIWFNDMTSTRLILTTATLLSHSCQVVWISQLGNVLFTLLNANWRFMEDDFLADHLNKVAK